MEKSPTKKTIFNKDLTKKVLKNTLLLIFFGLTFYMIYAVSKTLSGGNIASLKDLLSTVNPYYAILLAVIVLIMFCTDALKYSIISKITVKKFDLKLSMSVGIMGRFYDNITPFNTGGQPYQVYQYYKKGYPADTSTAIPIVKYIFQLIAWIVCSLILYLANHDALKYLPNNQAIAVRSLTYVGISIAAIAPLIVVLFSLFPSAIHKVIAFFIKIGVKLKIVPDYEKVDKKVVDFLEGYRQAFVHIAKDKVGVIFLFLVSCLDFFVVMSVPYFVIMALGKTTPGAKMLVDIVTLNAYSLFAASLVPTPGNSGAIEGVASMVFAPISMGEGALFWVVFMWRVCTYYVYIILGLVGMTNKFFKSRHKKRVIKKYKLSE